MTDFDLAIIGGGLLGLSIARDAAGRGLRVYLAEQNDLASGASHALFRLMEGGFNALGSGPRNLGDCLAMRAVFAERDIWLRIAPHLVRPQRVVRPVALGADMRGSGGIGAGRLQLLFHDLLANRSALERTVHLDVTNHAMGVPLKRPFGSALEYSACVADGVRLVALSAVDAAARGAVIKTGARVSRAERGEDWRLVVIEHGERRIVTARALVNATGAWTGESVETVLRRPAPALRLVKYGSVLVPRLYDHDSAYHLDDGPHRAIFVVPFNDALTQVGCASEAFSGDIVTPALAGHEISSLCKVVSRYFRQPIEPDDVTATFAAVRAVGHAGRPVVQLDKRFREAPLVVLYGASPALARQVAETVMMKLSRFFVFSGSGRGRSWTASEPLPGGDFPWTGFDDVVADTRFRWPFLSLAQAQRLVRAYGTRVEIVLGTAQREQDLGERFGAELTAAEARYLKAHEWARTADDVLSRRSNLGHDMPVHDRERLVRFMASS